MGGEEAHPVSLRIGWATGWVTVPLLRWEELGQGVGVGSWSHNAFQCLCGNGKSPAQL